VIAGGAAGGGWYYWNHFRRTVSTVASTPAPKSNAPTAASIATAVSLPVSQQSALADSPSFNSSASQSASNETAPEGFDNNRPVQVVLTAREAAWVQVSADGRTAFVGLLHPNDKRTIAADAQVRILTGNAGGLDISLNGKTLDPIGPRGQVRTVRLTAEGPQFVPQNPTASSPL
jgi:cytoskeletal protein RodZ